MNVHLPDDLAAAARSAGLDPSSLTQEATRRELAGRPSRAGDLDDDSVTRSLGQVEGAPIERHPVRALVAGAWARRHQLGPADASYVELAAARGAPLVTTDRRLQDAPMADVVVG